jgi:dihydrolipoamide dehydrogenase
MNNEKFDLIVLGGGPGGYVAAIRAAQLGMKTALVEREHLGGICLNWGCIPTKALLHTAGVYRQMRHAEELGLSAEGLSFDFKRVIGRSRDVAGRLNSGVGHLLKKNKVRVFMGSGSLLSTSELQVIPAGAAGKAVTLQGAHIIVATGARARDLPGMTADGDRLWNYRHALAAEALPASLLVVGGGAIGMEFASFYSQMGSRVTVIEAKDRILPVEDEEISAFARKAFEAQGISVLTGTTLGKLTAGREGVRVSLRRNGQDSEIDVERVLLSVGIVGNTEGLNLAQVGVRVEAGHIVTDAWGRTGVPGLYAIGDVAGGPWLAHKASHEAVVCVERIAGHGNAHPLQMAQIPSCTYCHPQVASIGLTEAQAALSGRKLRIGRFPFVANGKAIALGEANGFVKTVFDDATGELLGAHMCGPDVTELIHGFGIARALEATEAELMETVFPHPTLSEAMHEAVLAAYDRPLHF